MLSGVADIRKVVERARVRLRDGQGTVLFVDEIHRFNKGPAGRLFAPCGSRGGDPFGGHHGKPQL